MQPDPANVEAVYLVIISSI